MLFLFNDPRCDHEPLMSAADCLQNLIADGNPEHFWVATQDAELRIKLRQAS
jgi:U3 small nucleolar RNA-associated protein 23